MSNHDFRQYPKMAYLLMRESMHGQSDEFRIYTHRTFALQAAQSTPWRKPGIVFELPMPALNTLKVVTA